MHIRTVRSSFQPTKEAYQKLEFSSHFFLELPDLPDQVETFIFLHLADRVPDRIDDYAAVIIKQRTVPGYVFVYFFPLQSKLLRKHLGGDDVKVSVPFQKCGPAVIAVQAFGEF